MANKDKGMTVSVEELLHLGMREGAGQGLGRLLHPAHHLGGIGRD